MNELRKRASELEQNTNSSFLQKVGRIALTLGKISFVPALVAGAYLASFGLITYKADPSISLQEFFEKTKPVIAYLGFTGLVGAIITPYVLRNKQMFQI